MVINNFRETMQHHQRESRTTLQMSSQTIRRLKKELRNIQRDPVDGCLIEASNDNLFNWQATLRGSVGTPFEGGKFVVNIHYPQTYPLHQPIYTFATKLYHPNVESNTGVVNIRDLQNENWSPVVIVTHLLLSLVVLLGEPDLDCAVMQEIAKECKESPEMYWETAKKWTETYALDNSRLEE